MDSTMPDRGLPLSLWGIWWNAILLLRPAFSRLRTFMWFATAVAGLTVRLELLGVTSIVRALNLRPRLYTKLLDHFHSSGINLDRLSALWTQAVLQMFPHLVRVNGRLVLVGDGIKAPKRGKKMPAVKLLHQQSESNTKPEYIMGHSMQAVGLLVHAAKSVFCVPLAVRIHEGLVWSNRDKRTLLDKMLGLIDILALKAPFYFVADAYYAAGKMARGLLKQGNHLVTRVKSNAVAYAPATPKKGKKTRGRPKTYGKKKKLKSLFDDPKSMQQIASPVYGERNVTLSYRVCDMLWRPVGLLVRFVAVIHPTRGACILMCTDTTLCAVDIIRLYGLRFMRRRERHQHNHADADDQCWHEHVARSADNACQAVHDPQQHATGKNDVGVLERRVEFSALTSQCAVDLPAEHKHDGGEHKAQDHVDDE